MNKIYIYPKTLSCAVDTLVYIFNGNSTISFLVNDKLLFNRPIQHKNKLRFFVVIKYIILLSF